MKMLDEIEKTYDDICIMQNYSEAVSRNDADISVKYRYGSSIYSTRNPMIVSPMIHTASKKMITQSLFNGMIFVMHRYFKTPEEQITAVLDVLSEETFSSNYWLDLKTLYFAVGQCTKWIDHLYGRGVRNFCCDFSHGYSLQCINTIKYIKALDKDNHVMAGNVETYDGYMTLCKCGADMIRVGIASGSICSTSKNTAVGRPMISAIMDCSRAKYDYINRYVRLIADGGIRGAADIAKAIACGADHVMCGRLFASTSAGAGATYNHNRELTDRELGPCGSSIWSNGIPEYIEYAGMASHKMRQHNGSHRVSGVSIEGESGLVKYTGEIDDVINNIEANLRASISYVGARDWLDFQRKVVIAKMSPASIIEKQTHLDIND